MTEEKTSYSCESVDDVIFDLNGEKHIGLGWVVFEIDDEIRRQANGAIGFTNNVFTLKILQHLNTQRPLHIAGYFANSKKQSIESYVLNGVSLSGTLLSDEISFVLFRATLLQVNAQA